MKSIKSLIIPFVVLLVLIAGLIVWAVLGKGKGDTDPSEEADTSVAVLSLFSTDVSSLTVTSREGAVMNVVSTISETDGTQVFVIPDADETLELSQTSIQSYVAVLCNFYASSTVQNNAGLAEYGLDDPSYVIDITTASGETYKVLVGDNTYDNSKCYFTLQGDPNVYTIAPAKKVYCSYTITDFLDTQLLNIDYGNIATISFDRNSDNVHLIAECSVDPDSAEPAYRIIDPFDINGSAYFKNLVEYIATLEISSFIDIDDSELADYGLDDPEYRFVFSMKTGETIEVCLSRLIDDNYYGTCSEIDGYFNINSMQIDGLDTPLITLLESYVSYFKANQISSITGVMDDRSFEFEIDTTGAISDDGATVTLDMRNALVRTSEGRSYAAILFEALATIQIGTIDMEATPDYDPVLTFTFVLKDHSINRYDFVQRTNDSYYVFMNEEYTGFIVYSDELFRNGGTDTYGYGAWAAYELADIALSNAINGVYDVPES